MRDPDLRPFEAFRYDRWRALELEMISELLPINPLASHFRPPGSPSEERLSRAASHFPWQTPPLAIGNGLLFADPLPPDARLTLKTSPARSGRLLYEMASNACGRMGRAWKPLLLLKKSVADHI
jgi:hypothetical protein